MKHTIKKIALVALLTGSASAATILIDDTTRNGSFEDPNSGTVNFITGTITDWSNWSEIDTADNDTGTYTNGERVAYIQPGGAIRNITGHIIAVGDVINYGFTDHQGSRGDATMELVYDLGAGGGVVAITGTGLVGDGNVNDQVYTNSFTVQAGEAWVGGLLGVGLSTSESYPEVDHITLSVVPEPSSAALLGLGGLALILRRRK